MKTISSILITVVGGLIPELALSYIVMRIMDENWSIFFITYISIQIFYLIVWVFRTIVNWIFFRLFWKRELVREIHDSLIERQYPNKGYYITNPIDAETFFEEIVYDSELEAETRIHAATLCTRLTVLKEFGNLQGIIRLRKAAFQALKQYIKNDE